MAVDEEQQETISECFARGTVGEECDDCFCHPSNDGECCYGTDHEYGHKECRRCGYESSCARLTHGTSSRRVKVRRTGTGTGRNKTTRMRRRRQSVHNEEPLLQIPSRKRTTEKASQEECEEETGEETFMKRLGRVTGWGMIEGGLQMALSFFQRNRPE